jgi:hypothetical protein
MWTMRDPAAFFSLIAQVQPLLLLALVVELRAGKLMRRWFSQESSSCLGWATRVVVSLMALFGIIYFGIVEFACIAATAAEVDPASAVMNWRDFTFLTAPVGGLLLLTGLALMLELLIGEKPAKTASPDGRPPD